MNATLIELLALVKGLSEVEAFLAVDQHFQKIMFSLEADEWKVRMSQAEKEKFIKVLVSKSK